MKIINPILIMLLVGGLACQVHAFKIRYKTVYKRKYVYLKDVARYYGMQVMLGKKACELKSKYSTLRFSFQRRKGTINGITVHYHFAPFLENGEPLLSQKDFLLIVDPALRYKALKKHKLKTIMLDPGHGRKDEGARGRLFLEKDLVLKIAKNVRDKLTKLGYRVIMTRSSDMFLTLQQRANLCNVNKADLFVSIHCNATGRHSVKGVEVFAVTPAGVPSTADTQPQWKKHKGNQFDKNNFNLAYNIHKQLLYKTRSVDRGVKHARFYVIKEVNCPAALVEAGFISNPTEERKLGLVSYQEKIARAIVKGITNYHTQLKRIK